MRERGILFSAEMVRALLAGTKTQTRRIVKPQPVSNGIRFDAELGDIVCLNNWLPPDCLVQPPHYSDPFLDHPEERCPYGVVGDRLWVREAWALSPVGVLYRATDEEHNPGQKWKPSIHLHRARSRITLDITDVRVQRLHDLSEADAIAEGVTQLPARGGTPRATYAALWERINGAGSWDVNPWVWAVTFKSTEVRGV